MFSLILLLPLISFVSIIIFGSYIGTYGSMIVSCTNLLLSFLTAILSFFYVSHDFVFSINLWTWIDVVNLPISFGLRYDSLTAIMFIVVTTVSSVVHLYSCVYMYSDPFLSRFMSYLSLFTFFMFLLVSADNLLVLFMGWEGVGLCSYLLIGFWYTRAQAGKAATKAFIINKIGDLFLLTGISIVFMLFHTIEFSTLNVLSFQVSENLIELIAFFLFMGAVGKSAQVGLHTWLPDAMEGWLLYCWALLKFHYMREYLKTIWSTQKLFLLGKIQLVRQSAGNQILVNANNLGSSETTCEVLTLLKLC